MKTKLVILLAVIFSITSIVAAEKPSSPMTIKGATTVDAVTAKKLYDDGALFLDVRSNKDWANGRVPDALHLELKKVLSKESLAAEAGIDDVVVIYCNGEKCMRSSKASKRVVAWGYTKIHYFRDGFPAWKAAGYPTE